MVPVLREGLNRNSAHLISLIIPSSWSLKIYIYNCFKIVPSLPTYARCRSVRWLAQLHFIRDTLHHFRLIIWKDKTVRSRKNWHNFSINFINSIFIPSCTLSMHVVADQPLHDKLQIAPSRSRLTNSQSPAHHKPENTRMSRPETTAYQYESCLHSPDPIRNPTCLE